WRPWRFFAPVAIQFERIRLEPLARCCLWVRLASGHLMVELAKPLSERTNEDSRPRTTAELQVERFGGHDFDDDVRNGADARRAVFTRQNRHLPEHAARREPMQ